MRERSARKHNLADIHYKLKPNSGARNIADGVRFNRHGYGDGVEVNGVPNIRRVLMKAILSIFFFGLPIALARNVLADQPPPIQNIPMIVTDQSWDGSVLPAFPQGQPEISVLHFIIQPRAALPCHKHPFINAGVVMKGALKIVTQDQKVLHVKGGEPLVETVNEWHYGVNEGNDVAEVYIVYSGLPGQKVSIPGTPEQCGLPPGADSKK